MSRSANRTAGGRDTRRRLDLALLALLAVTLLSLLFFDRPLAVGDGLAYLIWLDSIAMDGDLDLSNQADKFAAVNTYHIYYQESTGRWGSAFSFGIALLLTPFYWVGALLDKLPAWRINDAHFGGIQGVSLAYSLCMMMGVNVYALLTVALGYHTARRFAGPWTAAAAALFIYLGTPLLFYSTVDPINSHIAGAFSASLFVWLWLRARDRPRASSWDQSARWVPVGLAAGLTALSRWQVVLIAVPAGVELLLGRRWREALLAAAGGAMLAWLIPYSWWQMFGSMFLVPAAQGDQAAFLSWPVNTLNVLFSPTAGLFPWSPIVGLAMIGLWPLFRRDWPLALGALIVFFSQALVNGMVRDWWAGIGFGMRRMAELYPLYVLLLAALLGAVSRRRWPGAAAWGLAAVLVLYGVALLVARLNFTWTNPWGLARDTPLKELTYTFSREHWPITWPVIRDHVGPWAWKKPGP